jgi:hypothetical protein
VNRSPSTTIECNIPEEVWKGHPCNYSNLKFFGCEAYALILKHQRSKLDPKQKRLIFVGYGDGIKGYRLWDPTPHNITINRDVIFDESSLIKSDVDVQMKQEEVPKHQQIQFETSSNTDESEHEQVSEDVHEVFPTEEDMVDDNNQQNVDEPQTSLRRSTWVRNPPRRYDDFVLSVSLSTNDDEPSCYQEAMKGSKSDKWK